MSAWTRWDVTAHVDVVERTRIKGRRVYRQLAPARELNREGNHLLYRVAYDPSRSARPSDFVFCAVRIDGFHHRTRRGFLEVMRSLTGAEEAYTAAMRVKDLLRWVDPLLLMRRRRERMQLRLDERAAALLATTSDVVTLHRAGILRASASGRTITRIAGEIGNLARCRAEVSIGPGTYFVSSGNHQNMVTCREYTFSLDGLETASFDVAAACINASLPIPGGRSRFRGVARVSDNLRRFLEAATGKSPMTIQAGVWAITDGYTAYQIETHLVSRDRYGNTRPAISMEEIAEAKRILDALGISHRLRT